MTRLQVFTHRCATNGNNVAFASKKRGLIPESVRYLALLKFFENFMSFQRLTNPSDGEYEVAYQIGTPLSDDDVHKMMSDNDCHKVVNTVVSFMTTIHKYGFVMTRDITFEDVLVFWTSKDSFEVSVKTTEDNIRRFVATGGRTYLDDLRAIGNNIVFRLAMGREITSKDGDMHRMTQTMRICSQRPLFAQNVESVFFKTAGGFAMNPLKTKTLSLESISITHEVDEHTRLFVVIEMANILKRIFPRESDWLPRLEHTMQLWDRFPHDIHDNLKMHTLKSRAFSCLMIVVKLRDDGNLPDLTKIAVEDENLGIFSEYQMCRDEDTRVSMLNVDEVEMFKHFLDNGENIEFIGLHNGRSDPKVRFVSVCLRDTGSSVVDFSEKYPEFVRYLTSLFV